MENIQNCSHERSRKVPRTMRKRQRGNNQFTKEK